jgi:hypothetical protein
MTQPLFYDNVTLDEFCIQQGYDRHVRGLSTVLDNGYYLDYEINLGGNCGVVNIGSKQFKSNNGVYTRSTNTQVSNNQQLHSPLPGVKTWKTADLDVIGGHNNENIGRWVNRQSHSDYELIVACEKITVPPKIDIKPLAMSSIHTEGIGYCECPEPEVCIGSLPSENQYGECHTSEGTPTGTECLFSNDCNIEVECDPAIYCFSTEEKSVRVYNQSDWYLDWTISSYDVQSEEMRSSSREEENDICLNGYCPGDYLDEEILNHGFEICYGSERMGENFTLSEIKGKIMFLEYSSAN